MKTLSSILTKKISAHLLVLMLILSTTLLSSINEVVSGANRFSVATGNWNSTSTWSATSGGSPGASAPVSGDAVMIEGGYTVTVNVASAAASVTVNSTGTLTVNSNLTIDNAGSFTANSGGAVAFNSSALLLGGGGGGNGVTLTIASGSSLTTANTGGIASNFGSGSIQINSGNKTVTWSTGANYSYNGSANQTVGTALPSTVNSLTINNSGGGGSNIVTLVQATTITTNLTITSGVFDVSTSNFAVNVKGNWGNSGTFTQRSGTVTFNGTSAQNVEGSTATTFNNLTINNSAGIALSKDITINATLTLTSGIVTTGVNHVILASAGTVSRTSGHVNGIFRKNIASSTSSKTFEIGDATNYAKIDLTFSGTPTNGSGYLEASTTSGLHAQLSSSGITSAKCVNRYWSITNSGVTFGTYSSTFNFVSGDVLGGASTGSFVIKKYSSSTWSSPTVGTLTSTSSQATGLSSFSDFAVGEACNLSSAISSYSHVNCGSNGSATVSASSGTTPYTYLWSNSGTTSSITNLAIGTYTVTVTDAGSCKVTASSTLSSIQDTITVNGSMFVFCCNNWFFFDSLRADTFSVDTTEITIKFKTSTTYAQVTTFRTTHSLSLEDSVYGFHIYTIPGATNVFDFWDNVALPSALIDTAYINIYGKFTATPNDPLFSDPGQWYLEHIGADDAWDLATGCPTIPGRILITAIIDAGTDWDHPDLGNCPSGSGYQNIYTNVGDSWSPVCTPSGNSVNDDSGQPYGGPYGPNNMVDDFKGWDFLDHDKDARGNPNTSTGGMGFHGTMIAGIVGGKTNNSVGISGIAGGWNDPGTMMLICRVGDTKIKEIDLVHAIRYSTDQQSSIIQLGLMFPSFIPTAEAAINDAYTNHNIFVVCSSGYGADDCGAPHYTRYPAAYPNVFAVGASDHSDQRPCWSEYGTFLGFGGDLDIAAPGVDIGSTYNFNGTLGYNTTTNLEEGNSFSAAMVSGTAALMICAQPTITNAEIGCILRATADKVGGYAYVNGFHQEMGFGRLNTFDAVNVAANPLAINCSGTNLLCNGTSTGTATVSATDGSSSFTYTWSNGGTSSTISGLSAGTYTVTVSDCASTLTCSYTVTQPSAISVSANSTAVCAGSTLNLSSTISGGTGSYTYSWSGPNSFTSTLASPSITSVTNSGCGTYTLTVTDANSCSATTATVVTVTACLNLKFYLQGYYISGSGGTMRAALYNEGCSGNTSIVDNFTVELRNTSSPYGIFDSSPITLNTNGTTTATFGCAALGNSYYLKIKHRPSSSSTDKKHMVETWSANPVAFSSNSTTNYDFTTAAGQAYQSNQIQVSATPHYAFYVSDINQDENVDITDFPYLDADINAGYTGCGYFSTSPPHGDTDLNGDGSTDLIDFPIYDANNSNGIFSRHP